MPVHFAGPFSVRVVYPGERGEFGVRRMSISGKLLTLVAKAHEMGEDHERKLVWERIPPEGGGRWLGPG